MSSSYIGKTPLRQAIRLLWPLHCRQALILPMLRRLGCNHLFAPVGSSPRSTKSSASASNSRFTMCRVARINPLHTAAHSLSGLGALTQ